MGTVSEHSVRASLWPAGKDLGVIEGRMTIDRTWAPYVQATLTVPQPVADVLAALDPREDVRVRGEFVQSFGESWPISKLTARYGGRPLSVISAEFAGRPISALSTTFGEPWNAFGLRAATRRRFDLSVRTRTLSADGATVSIGLESDEALLQDFALVDNAAYAPAYTSVRQIVAGVLRRIGRTLVGGTADGIVTAESSTWTPGQSAWDYLTPLLQKAGLRLWCDEMRRWHLDAADTESGSHVTLSTTGTIKSASDEITRNGDWFDAVLITYKWTDANKVAQVGYDSAQTPGYTKVLSLVYDNTPYPGPGAAALVLTRRLHRGRLHEITAVSDYSISPNDSCTIALDGIPLQNGYVNSVEWRVPADDMNVGTSSLVEVPPTAWDFLPPGESWNASAAGQTWNNETIGV